MCVKTYETNTLSESECRGEIEQYVHGWIEPFGPSFIATTRLIKILDLLLKDRKNGTGGIAGLEPGGEWMGK